MAMIIIHIVKDFVKQYLLRNYAKILGMNIACIEIKRNVIYFIW